MSTQEKEALISSVLHGNISRREFVTRATALGLSASGAAALLQACGGSTAATTTGPTSLALWHGWTGGDNTQALATVLSQFNKSGTITVKPTALPWDDLFSKWVTSFASGNPPDVIIYHPSELPEYAQRGITQPIDDLVKTANIDLTGVPNATIQAVHYKDQLYAVPGDLHPMGMYYNKDMVQQAGLDPTKPPTTKDELLHWADKLTIRNGSQTKQYGIYMQSTGQLPRWFWYSLLHQFGGTFQDSTGKTAVNSQASHNALQFLVDLFNKYKVVTPGTTNQGIDPVAAKKAAMWFIGPWEVNLRLQQKLNFATAPMPVIGTQPATWGNAHCMSISKKRNTDKYTDDLKFIKWFFENYALPAKVVGIIPLNPQARQSATFTDDERYPYYKAFISELNYVAMEPAVPQYSNIFSFGKPTPLSTNLEAAIAGSKSVEQALADMKQGIDAQLAQPI